MFTKRLCHLHFSGRKPRRRRLWGSSWDASEIRLGVGGRRFALLSPTAPTSSRGLPAPAKAGVPASHAARTPASAEPTIPTIIASLTFAIWQARAPSHPVASSRPSLWRQPGPPSSRPRIAVRGKLRPGPVQAPGSLVHLGWTDPRLRGDDGLGAVYKGRRNMSADFWKVGWLTRDARLSRHPRLSSRGLSPRPIHPQRWRSLNDGSRPAAPALARRAINAGMTLR